jgi:cysteine synthase
MRSEDALGAIGNTPLVRLKALEPANGAEIWIKLEGGNPTGSYKDRMAASVLGGAFARGDLRRGDRVVEYTGGSTGTALAFVSAVLGLRFTAVFSDAFSDSKRQAMEAFGADVIVEPSEDGAITPELIQRMKARAYALAEEPGSYYADQFGSPDVRAGYEPMGVEIARDLDGGLDVLVAAVGTGAALMGTVDGLAREGVEPRVVALEPLQSPLLTTGAGGPHRVDDLPPENRAIANWNLPLLNGRRRKDHEAQAIQRREDHWCAEGTGGRVEGGRDLPAPRDQLGDVLHLAEEVRWHGGERRQAAEGTRG